MISKPEAKKQLERLSQLVGFPNTKAAADDMLEALGSAGTIEIAMRVVWNVLDTPEGASQDDRRCPTAPKLRKMIYDASTAQREYAKSCVACGGSGATSIPYLVTYEGAGMKVKEWKRLGEFSWERASRLRGNLLENQDVVGVGEQCYCKTLGGKPIKAPDKLCRRCGDDGLYGGHIGGQYAGPWKWCDCASSRLRREVEPGLIEESNQVREKLLAGRFMGTFAGRI